MELTQTTQKEKHLLDEPTFTDLEPRAAGTSGDGYIWKYLYTIKPGDITKFDSTNFMPVPKDWATNATDAPVRDNAATSGQLKIVTITNRGVGLGTANQSYTKFLLKVMEQVQKQLLLLIVHLKLNQ